MAIAATGVRYVDAARVSDLKEKQVELTRKVAQIQARCGHKFKVTSRYVTLDESKLKNCPAEEQLSELCVIDEHCPKCELTRSYPVVEFCPRCKKKAMVRADGGPRYLQKVVEFPHVPQPPVVYACKNAVCGFRVVIMEPQLELLYAGL